MDLALENREIRGVTWKLFWIIMTTIMGLEASAIFFYVDLKTSVKLGTMQSVSNMTEISLMRTDAKETDRQKDIRLTSIELEQRELSIRLAIVETKLGITNRFQK